MMIPLHNRHLLDRRSFLANTATGISGIALAHLLAGEGLMAVDEPIKQIIDPKRPAAHRQSHFPGPHPSTFSTGTYPTALSLLPAYLWSEEGRGPEVRSEPVERD